MSDSIWFPLLEGAFVVFAIVAVLKDRWLYSGSGIQVLRSEGSMARFYTVYGAATGILVALALGVEVAAEHRTLLVVLNVAVPAYLCLFNAWFRNKLVGWSNILPMLEHR
jgi:hypothetical protein